MKKRIILPNNSSRNLRRKVKVSPDSGWKTDRSKCHACLFIPRVSLTASKSSRRSFTLRGAPWINATRQLGQQLQPRYQTLLLLLLLLFSSLLFPLLVEPPSMKVAACTDFIYEFVCGRARPSLHKWGMGPSWKRASGRLRAWGLRRGRPLSREGIGPITGGEGSKPRIVLYLP